MPRSILLAAVVSLAAAASAQYNAFQWKFGNNFIGVQFTECQSLPIVVQAPPTNASSIGVPPYYLVAFELGGVPTTTNLGSDLSNLTWKNTHKRGSTLMLTMVDSNATTAYTSNTGGVSPTLYNVTAGSDASCLTTPASTAQLAVVHSNVTGTLTTCEPWGLTIVGGTKPYTVVLAALDSPITTNVTMAAPNDVFTYPNRADPGGQMMASVADATGKWGVSTAVVHTAGSADTNCTGLVSTSQTQQQIQQEAAARTQAAADTAQQRRRRLGLGVGLGVGLPLLAALAALALCVHRRRMRNLRDAGTWDHPDAVARPYAAAVPMREVEPSTPGSSKYAVPPDSPAGTPFPDARPPVYTGPAAPSPTATATTSSSAGSKGRPRRARAPVELDPDAQPDIIIQHRDGGGAGVVHELPPPYAARLARALSAAAPRLSRAAPPAAAAAAPPAP